MTDLVISDKYPYLSLQAADILGAGLMEVLEATQRVDAKHGSAEALKFVKERLRTWITMIAMFGPEHPSPSTAGGSSSGASATTE